MREIQVNIAPDAKLDKAEAIIEAACAAEGLRLTLKGTLKQYPGCIHWHYKFGKAPGTLEITLWASKRRLWFKVSANRQGEWMEKAIERLKVKIEAELV
ncbi:MAG: hypothetical protein ABI690_02810 [Chloroflexota bacterium]